MLDLDEEIGAAAEREVFEETGIRTSKPGQTRPSPLFSNSFYLTVLSSLLSLWEISVAYRTDTGIA